jgi:Tol biopolymer transport system component
LLLSRLPPPEPRLLAWRAPAVGAETENGRDALATAAADVSPRRLSAGGRLPHPASVSADGRYLTDTDWPSGSLLVTDLATGERHVIAERAEGSAYGSANAAVFSRDGRRLGYIWIAYPNNEQVTEVRIIDFDGDGTASPRVSEPRTIDANAVQYPADLWDWSPDGRWLLGKTYGPDNSVALRLFSSAGDTTRTLKTLDWREPLRAAFSPDGRFVAYDLPAESDRRVRSIFVVSLDGSRERVVVGDGALNRLFGWDPDGGLMLDVAGRRLRWTPDGSAILIFGQDGRGRQGIYRVQLATGAHEIRMQVTDDGWSPVNFDVSSDGATLYYTRAERGGQLALIARPLAGGAERPLAVVSVPGHVAVSPDDSEIAATIGPFDPDLSIVGVVPADGGAPRELFRLPAPWGVFRLAWTPDGDKVILVAWRSDRPAETAVTETAVWLLPVRGGEPRRLDGLPHLRQAVPDPSGRRLAFMLGEPRHEIWALDRDRGQY